MKVKVNINIICILLLIMFDNRHFSFRFCTKHINLLVFKSFYPKMHFNTLYWLFCVLCVAQPPPGGPQDGLSGRQEHYPPGGPQDGLSGRTDDDLANLDQELPTSDDLTAGEIFLEHSFVKKEHTVKQGKDKGGKKVFDSLVLSPYIFKRRQNPKEDGLVTLNKSNSFNL